MYEEDKIFYCLFENTKIKDESEKETQMTNMKLSLKTGSIIFKDI